jgi:hypothetical protein
MNSEWCPLLAHTLGHLPAYLPACPAVRYTLRPEPQYIPPQLPNLTVFYELDAFFRQEVRGRAAHGWTNAATEMHVAEGGAAPFVTQGLERRRVVGRPTCQAVL